MKKSYNPFKLWGSYVGTGIFILSVLLAFTLSKVLPVDSAVIDIVQLPFVIMIWIAYIPVGLISKGIGPISATFYQFSEPRFIYTLILVVILSFLIGWGVHALIRKFMR